METIGDQGDGIARVERGYVVIVPDTDPHEHVEIEITSVAKTVPSAKSSNATSTTNRGSLIVAVARRMLLKSRDHPQNPAYIIRCREKYLNSLDCLRRRFSGANRVIPISDEATIYHKASQNGNCEAIASTADGETSNCSCRTLVDLSISRPAPIQVY
ncbi:TRAM domain-containing protein [Halalkalicoccus tibetensis]|uniref:TRAM domain-containing protein n=1 Tax=Halalkalicoccus tibetensis TaxID=175632 RepID=A0ABD5V588_9EURY